MVPDAFRTPIFPVGPGLVGVFPFGSVAFDLMFGTMTLTATSVPSIQLPPLMGLLSPGRGLPMSWKEPWVMSPLGVTVPTVHWRLIVAGLPVVRSITLLIVTVSPVTSPLVDAPRGRVITNGLLVLVMLKIELPTMVPGYPLKLTPKTPVRPLPLMVTTAPGSAPVGPVIPVGTTVPLVIEKVNACRALSFGGIQVPTELALKVTKAAFQVQVPVLGGMVVPSPLLGVLSSFSRSKEAGVLVVFAMTFVTSHRPLMAESFTPLIVTTSPMARVPVSAVIILIVRPRCW